MISTVHSSYGIEINIPRKRQVLYQQVITITLSAEVHNICGELQAKFLQNIYIYIYEQVHLTFFIINASLQYID